MVESQGQQRSEERDDVAFVVAVEDQDAAVRGRGSAARLKPLDAAFDAQRRVRPVDVKHGCGAWVRDRLRASGPKGQLQALQNRGRNQALERRKGQRSVMPSIEPR